MTAFSSKKRTTEENVRVNSENGWWRHTQSQSLTRMGMGQKYDDEKDKFKFIKMKMNIKTQVKIIRDVIEENEWNLIEFYGIEN